MQGGIGTLASVCYSLMVSLLQDGVEGEEGAEDTQEDGREEEEEDGMVGEVDTEGKEEDMVMAAMVLEDTISSNSSMNSNNITTHNYNCTICC